MTNITNIEMQTFWLEQQTGPVSNQEISEEILPMVKAVELVDFPSDLDEQIGLIREKAQAVRELRILNPEKLYFKKNSLIAHRESKQRSERLSETILQMSTERVHAQTVGRINLISIHLGLFNNIEVLIFVEDGWEVLPARMFDLVQLRHLEICNSRISKLPSEMKNFQKLERLTLVLPKCTQFPEVIGELTNLKYLHIVGSFTTIPPKVLEMLTSLEVLSIQAPLIELPENFPKIPSLKKLCLMQTDIVEIPDSIQNLVGLEKVVLKFNTKLSGEKLFALTNLSKLKVMQYIPDIFVVMESFF